MNADKRLLREIFLFEGVPADAVADMAAQAAATVFPKGAVIYAPQAYRQSLGIVLGGTAQVWRVAEGRRARMKEVPAGQVFGAAALYGAKEYVTEVTAKTACKVAFLSQEQISGWMYQYPRMAENYIGFLSDRIRFLNRRITAIAGGDAKQKLAAFLQTNRANGEKTNLAQLAEQLNIGRTSLYRALDTLEREGAIRRDGGSVIWIGGQTE